MWIETGFRRQRVINDYLHTTAQFEYTTGDDCFACLQAIDYINKITAPLSKLNELLSQYTFGLTGLFILLLFYNENRVTKGGISNGCCHHG